tara:strand:- start:842 stop:1201 length:360 start_codon:yes stop_codon:yes gene_type:complete
MKELTSEELRSELLNLDSSNGWGVDCRLGVCVRRKKLVAEVEGLVEEFGSFPINQTLESEYNTIIARNSDGSYTYGIRYEVSMLNYQKFEESGESLNSYANQLATFFFSNHINKVKVLG